MAEFERHIIQDCILKDITADVTIPVAAFEVVYNLDQVPTMQITPALGRDLFNQVAGDFSLMRERDQCQLILTIDGEDKLLMEGFVASLSGSDNAGIFKRTVSAIINIKHNAVLLANNPPMASIFTGNNQSRLVSLAKKRKNRYFEVKPGGGQPPQFLALSTFTDSIIKSGGGQNPAVIFDNIIKAVAEDWNLNQQDIEDLIKTREGSTFDVLAQDETFITEIAKIYLRLWPTSNMWGALVAAANAIFMRIVPFNTGFYIGNPLASVRTPHIQLKSTEYIAISQSVVDNLKEPVDGVLVRDPTDPYGVKGPLLQTAFPPLTPGDEAGKNKYYHFVDFPAWASFVKARFYSPIPKGGIKKNGGAGVEKKEDPATVKGQAITNLEEYYRRVGVRVAKVIYSMKREKKVAVAITLPYRDDLMPGSIVELENSGAFDLSFLGGTTYFGMIQGMRIKGDMTTKSGTLNTTLNIVSIRNAVDNADDTLTFDEHPLCTELWKAIDLFGEDI